ncbi:MAG TPA: NAD(P)H-hydrate dehydratase [Bacteroidales bacterium]|nr:NAD(P)H-hydrate dehydratase [Bacteroidales bacterium]
MMKILTCDQIREVDQYTIQHEPISSVDLMERASQACFDWFKQHFDTSVKIKVFVGPGNNGGDGLAIARMLAREGFKVAVYMLFGAERLSSDALANYNRLAQIDNVDITIIDNSRLPVISEDDVVIDAMFGSGLSRKLEGPVARLVNHINQAMATIVAIDIPSGLFGEENTFNPTTAIIQADYTLTFQMPKLSFFFAENDKYLGVPVVLDIHLSPEGIDKQSSNYAFATPLQMQQMLKTRPRFSHKGTYGHALLLAGSYGKIGAGVLSSRACLRSGVGLLTFHVPKIGYGIVQSSVPETMISVDEDEWLITQCPNTDKYSAIGIGPGIGTSKETAEALYKVIKEAHIPLVLDADALNILALYPDWIRKLPANTILTPHPREFDRMAGASSSGYERHLKQIEFSRVYQVVVVLKGAYTSITSPDGRCWFNSTGNPGMATGGSGDVLTGIILSLLAQGYEPYDAARLGVYVHGLSGDIALAESSEEALIASDIINHLGLAFKKIKNLT